MHSHLFALEHVLVDRLPAVGLLDQQRVLVLLADGHVVVADGASHFAANNIFKNQ